MKYNNLETPYFMIDKKELDDLVTSLNAALEEHWSNYLLGYSFKTNSLLWLLEYFRKNNFYAEVVSDDEYLLALAANYEKDKIIYNGPPKSKETFLEAIQNGSIVNIDSQRELDWLNELVSSNNKHYEVGIRVNFDLEKYAPNSVVMGSEGGRFGFCYENGELKKAIDYIDSLDHVRLKGLHLHCSSKTRGLDVYKAISRVACEIKREYSLDLTYVNVGGGFYGGLKDKPQFTDYLEVISNELSKEFDKKDTVLILEPGASLVGSPFSFVTSVIDVKETTLNTFVTTDGSRTNIDPRFNKSNYFYKLNYGVDAQREVVDSQVISGFTCMEDDRFFKLENHKQLLPGDQVIFEKTGAYTLSLSPLFIKYFPDIYVEDNENIFKVRDRWKVKEYLMNQFI